MLNPWRKRVYVKNILHVPIVLYSDENSGNIFKKWNKHMAFYCSLAGLPPKMTNKEYNTHFPSTSNVATVLELADGLVGDMM